MPRRAILLLAGIGASVATGIVFSFLIASTNLGLSGFIPALITFIPVMICIGAFIGFMAHLTRLQGCSVMTIASVAVLVGIIPIGTFIKRGLNPVIAYSLGMGIGIFAGLSFLLFVSLIAWLWRRMVPSEE